MLVKMPNAKVIPDDDRVAEDPVCDSSRGTDGALAKRKEAVRTMRRKEL